MREMVTSLCMSTYVFTGKRLTLIDVAACTCPRYPAAFINAALPLAAQIPINEVGVLTADEQAVEVVTEVLQFHPGRAEISIKERKSKKRY